MTVVLEIFDLSMETHHLKEGLRSVSTMLGALYVVKASVVTMHMLPVDNLETSLVII